MSGPTATGRAQPFYCPYCGEEDFVPDAEVAKAYVCNSCLRRYQVTFLGVAPREHEAPVG